MEISNTKMKKECQKVRFSNMCLSGTKNPKRNFTEDAVYPVLDKIGEGLKEKIKTVDNQGNAVWVNSDYFTDANPKLTFGDLYYRNDYLGQNTNCDKLVDQNHFKHRDPVVTLKCENQKSEKVDSLYWSGLDEKQEVPKLRTKDYKLPEKIAVHTNSVSLAGLEKDVPPPAPTNLTPVQQELNVLAGVKKPSDIDKSCDDKSYERIDTVLSKVGKVFKEYRHYNHENIAEEITKAFPKRKIEWREGNLYIDGARTKIAQKDLCNALKTLENLASKKNAEQIIGKLIVKKLKKLF
jgi:hypothetical protein